MLDICGPSLAASRWFILPIYTDANYRLRRFITTDDHQIYASFRLFESE